MSLPPPARRNIIVFDTATTAFHGNRIFDRTIAERYPGATAIARFAEVARANGYAVVTSEVIDNSPPLAERAILITEQTTPWTERWRAAGAVLGVVMSFETPISAWRFYRNLPAISAKYRYAFLYGGAASRVSPGVRFRPTTVPCPRPAVSPMCTPGWTERHFMALANSNVTIGCRAPVRYMANLRDPALRRDIYGERRAAIRYFHRMPGFHVFGRGWDRWRLGASYLDYRAARRCYRGTFDSKFAVLSRYRFSICFENTIFPGYVTEKIFDCLLAGCVPIYYGAPDIDQFIPRECYIDFRDMMDYDDLNTRVRSFGPKDFAGYREATAAFVQSKQFKSLSEDQFAEDLVAAVSACATE